MANEIVNAGLSPAATYTQSVQIRLEEMKKTETAKPAVPADQLELSDAGKTLAAESGFDAGKVAAIKQAIADGNYPLDARRMAESFAALEKMMNRGVPAVSEKAGPG